MPHDTEIHVLSVTQLPHNWC